MDIRKPTHAVAIGVILASIAAPVLGYLDNEAHYRLAADEVGVMSHANDRLGKMLSYDQKNQVMYFNKDGQPPGGDNTDMVKVGSGSDKMGYSAKMPVQAGTGIKLTDTQHQVSATMSPQYATMDGRVVKGRVLYPLKDQPGVLALTPKGNGMKEDIVLNGAPLDREQYDYQLNLDDGLEARLEPNGAIGVWSGDPALFGNISFGSDTDKARVMNARKVADKNYLMFEIPAPVVKESGGKHDVKAHFMLKGSTLSVVATGLSKAAFPLSIDPSFVITTQSDFLLGRIEDNLTLTITSGTDAQLNRAKITGGNTNTWGTAVSGTLPAGCSQTGGVNYNFGLTAYNGYLYLVGGGDAVAHTCYTAINSNGTLGTWAATTTTFPTGREGAQVFGFNGYIYVIGGESANGNTQYSNVEYAPVTSSGDITATWTNNSAYYIGVGRVNFGVVEYDGYAYACGGATAKNNGSLVTTCEYTKINTDGTLQKPTTGCTLSGTATNWCTTSSFNTARNRFGMVAYNGFLYIVGGLTATPSVTTDVQYAPIANDNTIGTWGSTTALSTGWRSGGIAAEDGHLYLVGGCTSIPSCNATLLSSTQFTPINADGTLAKWDTTNTITTARIFNGVTSYNGAIYSIGGCTNEPTNSNNCNAGGALGDSQYAIINGTPNSSVTYPGSLMNFATAGNAGTARNGVASLAYGGYLYAAGGCNGANCATMTNANEVDYAPINDDGTIGTWNTTTVLPANRYGGALVGFRGKVYFLGGNDGTNAQNTVYSGSPSSGAISAWTTETNTFATARYWFSAAVYQNYIYIWGGQGASGPFNTVEYTQINDSGNFASPANCVSNGGTLNNNWCKSGNNMGTARYGFAGVAYAGYLYAAVGLDSSNAALNSVERAAINSSDGYPGSWSTTGQTSLTDTTVGHKFVSATVSKGIIYIIGGINGTPAASNATSYGALDSSGNVVTWTKSSRNLTTARWGAGAASAGGKVYTVGGCTNTASPCTTGSYVTTAGGEYSQVLNGGTGMTSQTNASTWSSGTALSSARGDLMSVAFNAKVYIMGGCTAYTSGACSTWTTEVRHATINGDGSLGSWSATSGAGSDAQLSTQRAMGGAIAYAGHIYVVGGSVGTSNSNMADATVQYATLDATGVITSWTDTSSQSPSGALPAGRSFFGIGTANGFMYVAGGCTAFSSGACTTRGNDVIYTQMGENGTLLAPACSDGTLTRVWCASSHTFTGSRQELSAIGYNSALYVMGGYDGTNNLGDVQYATLGTDGSLSSFSYTNYQDRLQRARNTVSANGFLYTMGDESSGTQVQYMPINANHTLGEQSRASSAGMANAHAHGQVVFNDGFFYALGGCTLSSGTCSTAGSTVDYVGQKANARKGHYAKMFNTEVNTSPTLVQVNGTGQYVIEMRTAAVGSTQLGVAQVITPAYATKFYFLQALDTSGTNVGIAFDYFIFLTIDDQQTGPFPDSGSVATDVNVYYHPNPGRRLRHGASFTNTGCNRDITQGCLLDTAQ